MNKPVAKQVRKTLGESRLLITNPSSPDNTRFAPTFFTVGSLLIESALLQTQDAISGNPPSHRYGILIGNQYAKLPEEYR